MNTLWWKIGTLSLGSAVALDAFGYHVLTSKKRNVAPYYREIWKIAGLYHFVHSFAMIFMATQNLPNVNIINGCFALGMFLFSGSLYGITITKQSKLAMATPIGGITFVIGWLIASLCVLPT